MEEALPLALVKKRILENLQNSQEWEARAREHLAKANRLFRLSLEEEIAGNPRICLPETSRKARRFYQAGCESLGAAHSSLKILGAILMESTFVCEGFRKAYSRDSVSLDRWQAQEGIPTGTQNRYDILQSLRTETAETTAHRDTARKRIPDWCWSEANPHETP